MIALIELLEKKDIDEREYVLGLTGGIGKHFLIVIIWRWEVRKRS